MNCGSSVDGIYVWLLLLLVSLAVILLAVKTRVIDWCVLICVLLVYFFVVVLLVSEFGLLFVCSVGKSFVGHR